MYKKLEAPPQALYGCVVKERAIFAEAAVFEGNFSEVTRQLLKQGLNPETKMSINYKDTYHIHYHTEGPMAYILFADSGFSKRMAFMLVDDLREVTNRVNLSSPTSLSLALKEKLAYYNSTPDLDKLATARKHIEEVNTIMLMNIDKVLERGTKIEILVDKAEMMEEKAVAFKKTAVKVKRHFWWLNIKFKIAVGFVILVILLIIIDLIICGGRICFTFT